MTVKYGKIERVLAAQRSRQVPMFRKLETLVAYLKEIGIGRFDVDAFNYDPTGLALANRVDSRLHVVVDPTLRNTTKDPKGMPMRIKQHFMLLLVIGPKDEGSAVRQLKLGNL